MAGLKALAKPGKRAPKNPDWPKNNHNPKGAI
jgi:hypothetical protein